MNHTQRTTQGILGIALLLALWVPSHVLAEIPEQWVGMPVIEISMEGDFSAPVDPREIGIPLGAPISRELVRRATYRLARSGRWEDVQFRMEAMGDAGIRIVAMLEPRIALQRIEVWGNRILEDEDVLRAAEIGEDTSFQSSTLPTVVDRIKARYREAGYHDTQVETVLRDTDDTTRKVLILRLQEGPPTRITGFSFLPDRLPEGKAWMRKSKLRPSMIWNHRQLIDRLRRLQQTLRNEGWLQARFSDPHVERNGQQAQVSVGLRLGPHYTLRIHGEHPLDRQAVIEHLNLSEERLTNAVLQAAVDRLRDLYHRHGFEEARITTTIRHPPRSSTDPTPEPDRVELHINIETGPQHRVVAIAFPGAVHFRPGFLRRQVYSYLEESLPGSTLIHPVDSQVVQSVGFGSRARNRRKSTKPFVANPQHIYHQPTYESAANHISELYKTQGFLHVNVGAPTVKPIKRKRQQEVPGHQSLVEIPIIEGPQTFLHNVEFVGNESISSATLIHAIRLERGTPFSHLSLEEARIEMINLYQDRGHFYARIEAESEFSTDQSRALVRFHIVERFKVKVGNIRVLGAEETRLSIIRDRLKLHEGGLYRPAAVRESQENLMGLGVFSSATIAPEDPELPAEVKTVVVTVTERKPQYLDFNVGVSTGEGARGGFEYGYRNLFGSAVSLALRVQLAYQFFFVDDQLRQRYETLLDEEGITARLERNITIGLGIPHAFRLPNVRLSFDVVQARDNERDFGLDQNSLGMTWSWRPSRRWNTALSEQLENNNVDLLTGDSLNDYLATNTDPRLERLLRVPEGRSTIVSTQWTTRTDFRDNPFVPSRGFFFSTFAEYAQTLNSEQASRVDASTFRSNFIKTQATATAYMPITDGWVWANQIRGGRVFHLESGSQTYPNRRFFLGGVDTMRGYLQDAMVPQDVAEQIQQDPNLTFSDVVRGGDTFLLARSELRFPITGSLRGGIFNDLGNLWVDPTQFNPAKVRPTAGFGIRLQTPVGPLAFDYGIILTRRRELGEPFGAFHFSIGLF